MHPRHTYTEPIYTIGIAAKKVGLSIPALRLYETEGLILTYKTETGRRLYSDLEIEKINCIHSMVQKLGLNYEGIRRIMAMVPCWKMRNCSKDIRSTCNICSTRTGPCWNEKNKCAHSIDDCRQCDVYIKMTHCEDIQKYCMMNS